MGDFNAAKPASFSFWLLHNKAHWRPQWSNVLVYLGVKEMSVSPTYCKGRLFYCGRTSPMTVLWPKTSKIFQIKGEIHLNFLKLEVVHAVGPSQDRRRVLSINGTRWIDKKTGSSISYPPLALLAEFFSSSLTKIDIGYQSIQSISIAEWSQVLSIDIGNP